jgi:hypothetical protein
MRQGDGFAADDDRLAAHGDRLAAHRDRLAADLDGMDRDGPPVDQERHPGAGEVITDRELQGKRVSLHRLALGGSEEGDLGRDGAALGEAAERGVWARVSPRRLLRRRSGRWKARS